MHTMDLEITLLLVLSVLTIAVIIYFLHVQRSNSSRRKVPPGPYPLPIIGNIHQLGQRPHQTITKLSKTYGPLMSLKFGTLNVVIVSSPEIAKEILQKHDQSFLGRFVPMAAEAQNFHKNSMAFLPVVGDKWRRSRKICREQMFSTLRLDASQGLRKAKLKQMYEYLNECCISDRVVNIEVAAFTTTLNLMSTTLFSVDFANYDSNSTHEYMEAVQGVMDTVSAPNLADFFPILRVIDPQGIKRRADFCFGKLLGIFEDLINQRLESREDHNAAAGPKKYDLLEALLDLRQGNEYDLSCNDIKFILFDLFIGGADTTSSMVDWAMTELLLNPEKISKVRNELRAVTGDNKQIDESDISKLPYLQAVIKEVLRRHPPGPLLLPHKAEADVEIMGYMIPKNTQIFTNVWGMGRDSSIWPNPNSFEPERFIDRKIDFRGHDFELIPFSSGRRICPGMALANRMLPLMVATLTRDFNWKLEPGMTLQDLDMNEKFGLSLRRLVPLKAVPSNFQV